MLAYVFPAYKCRDDIRVVWPRFLLHLSMILLVTPSSVVGFLFYFGYQSFIGYAFCEYFLPICGLCFHSLNSAFCRAGGLNFNEVRCVNLAASSGAQAIVVCYHPQTSFYGPWHPRHASSRGMALPQPLCQGTLRAPSVCSKQRYQRVFQPLQLHPHGRRVWTWTAWHLPWGFRLPFPHCHAHPSLQHWEVSRCPGKRASWFSWGRSYSLLYPSLWIPLFTPLTLTSTSRVKGASSPGKQCPPHPPGAKTGSWQAIPICALYFSLSRAPGTPVSWASPQPPGSQSAWAAITKYHRVGGLNNRHLLLIILEAGKSRVKVLPGSVSSESSLPGLQMAVSHCVFTKWRAAECILIQGSDALCFLILQR